MTFAHTTTPAGITAVCGTCGDYITSPFGLVIKRFERTHVCERRVA